MGKSKRAQAFERFRFSDPGWEAVVVPVSGSPDNAIVASRIDPHTGRRLYGGVLAQYASKTVAERLAADLNATKAELLAKAFP